MSHFVKGQGLVRTSFKSNVELRSANVDFVAGKYIINPRSGFAEGLSSVTVNDESIGKALITNPSSLTEVHLPAEYTAIGPKAFDGCANLTGIYIYAGQVISISEDAIPSGCAVYVDYEFVTEYQTLHPTLDIRGFDSGYVWEIPYVEGVTPTTLTAQYINDLVAAMGDAKDNVGKVVVPSYFTDYESGALDGLFTQLTNMEEMSAEALTISANDASSLLSANNKAKTLSVYDFTAGFTAPNVSKLKILKSGNVIWDTGIDFEISNDIEIEIPNATRLDTNQQLSHVFKFTNLVKDTTNLKCTLSFPNVTQFATTVQRFTITGVQGVDQNLSYKVILGAQGTGLNFLDLNNCPLKIYAKSGVSKPTFGRSGGCTITLYFPTEDVVSYIENSTWNTSWKLDTWASTTPTFVGYLDYTDTIPTFSGYAAQWYEDEDCTTPIATSAFVSGNRYFVKLTANS